MISTIILLTAIIAGSLWVVIHFLNERIWGWVIGMAELADAHGLGPCDSNFLRVQVPFPAFLKKGRQITEQGSVK